MTQTKTQTYVDIHLEPQGHIFIFIIMYCSFCTSIFFKGVVSKEILSWCCVFIMACPFVVVVVVVVCLFVCLFVMMPLCALYLSFLSMFRDFL